MNKIIKIIEKMIIIEKEAQCCPDCVIGAFCTKHSDAFWKLWRQIKCRLLDK